jgi:hypothetical protein
MVAKEIKEVRPRLLKVVPQLPQVQVREGIDAEGNEVEYVSLEEALTEILETVRELKKGLI